MARCLPDNPNIHGVMRLKLKVFIGHFSRSSRFLGDPKNPIVLNHSSFNSNPGERPKLSDPAYSAFDCDLDAMAVAGFAAAHG